METYETFEVLGSNFMDVIRKQRVGVPTSPTRSAISAVETGPFKGGILEVFLVGCGALGCEYLKGLALMGLAAMLGFV